MARHSNNLHDKFVKEMFADKGMAIAFLDAFLPADVRSLVRLEELTYVEQSFITEDLREIFSDVIVKCPTTSATAEPVLISILIEHKSYPDKWVNIQIMAYLALAYLRQVRNKQPFHPIIPIIYYQGQQPWSPPSIRELAGTFPDPLLPFLPEFRSLVIALMTLEKENLDYLRDQLLRSAMMAQRHRFDPIRLVDDLSRILQTIPPDMVHRNFIKSIFVYVLGVSEVNEQEIVTAINQLPPPLKDTAMTSYDLITSRARNEGKLEGKIEGKLEGKIETILHANANGLDIALIANITTTSEEEVTRILKEHGKLL